MKISYNWLKEYIEIEQSVEEIADVLTATGLEVEGIEAVESIKGGLKGVVIGEVVSCEKHPDADKLSKTTVDVGGEELLPIVCGAPNVAAGQKVVVATVGSILYPAEGSEFKIKKAKIRGEVSIGMLCAEDELGLGKGHDGILVLETKLPNGTPAAEYFAIENDYRIEIGLTPNRADAVSHIGVARDLKAYYNKEVHWPDVSTFEEGKNDAVQIVVENKEGCPHYCGVVIKGVAVKESPDWLKNRLKTIGLAPINNVVDSTNYVLHEAGHPLHAFDLKEIKGNQVKVKNLPAGTAFVTLDGVERKLNAFDLMICNGADEPMCIGGVFGGKNSGVSSETVDVFLESAYFDMAVIRKTAMHHGLKTDASFRYERGVDPNATIYALKRAALLIQSLAGGTIDSPLKSVGNATTDGFKIEVQYKHIDRLIGKQIGTERIKEILTGLDIVILNATEEGLSLEVPAYRVDVQREADVIEEILRIYGFNNVELQDFNGSEYLAEYPEVDADKVQDKITSFLVANGFYEIMTNSLTKPEYAATFGASPEHNVEIKNKLSEDLGVMRQSLFYTGLEVVAYNSNHKQEDLHLFEFGNTYKLVEGKYKEQRKLSLFMTGKAEGMNWISPARNVHFHDLAAHVLAVLRKLITKDFSQSQFSDATFEYGLDLKVNNKTLVQLGLLNKKIMKKYALKQPVFMADIHWDLLLTLVNDNIVFEEVSKFPEVKRDLSLVIDKSVTFDEIKSLVTKVERRLIKNIGVFDVYEGDKIDEGKKAYALSFTLQDQNKTLTDKIIDKTMNRLIQNFESELGAIIRK